MGLKSGFDAMLIEFSVENFRSFSKKQTFSMVASASRANAQKNRHAVASGNSAAPHVLLEACLFGANGSGKSALIEAITFMGRFIETSSQNAKAITARTPFAYHNDWRDAPSEFEIVFIHDGSLFQYGFVLDKTRVLEEWLFERPNATNRLRQIFSRAYDDSSAQYKWETSATHLKGERESWKAQTPENALFLTTAVRLNAHSLQRPFEWLTGSVRTICNLENLGLFTAEKISQDEEWKTRILEFLAGADLYLADIHVREIRIVDHPDFISMPDDAQSMLRSSIPDDAQTFDIASIRTDNTGASISLPWDEESSGTQGLFALAGPILDTLDKGRTLIVDELNTRMHPLAFHYVTRLFCNPETNQHNAQLIFTTHDVTAADQECISKDQIWMVEKGEDLASYLKPFSDYKTRDTRTFRRDYLNGRFGAVPRLAG